MFAVFKRAPPVPAETLIRPPTIDTARLVCAFSQRSSDLGREAAEVRGVLDDTQKIAFAQAVAVQALAHGLQEVVRSQAGIAAEVALGLGLGAVSQVADAVKDLAAKVERSSKAIMGTVAQLGSRIDTLSRENSRDAAPERQGAVYRALAVVNEGVQRIADASAHSREVCAGLSGQMGASTSRCAARLRR